MPPNPFLGASVGSGYQDLVTFHGFVTFRFKKISSSKCRGPKYFLRKPNHIVQKAHFYAQFGG